MLWIKIKSIIEYSFLHNKLVNNREAFDKYIYTDIDSAIKELRRRQEDKNLNFKLANFFTKKNIPNIFLDKKGKLILLKHLATPNYDTSRFIIAADAIGIKPIILEYLDDKFSAHNIEKKSLGKLYLLDRVNKNDGTVIKKVNIIDFSKSDGKKISEIKTNFSDSLVNFHHEIFNVNFPNHSDCYFDGSDWLKRISSIKKRYEIYMSMFVSNNILFDNFCIDKNPDKYFTEKVFLPAFILIKNIYKCKPIIVALEPTDLEGSDFWLCHNHMTQKIIYDKIKNNGK